LTAESDAFVNRIYAKARLSRRETDVLRLLGDVKNKRAEIAAKLKISLKTVNEYCARLKKNLDAAKFNQLLRIAVL
jgi:DNA-binding CsgD family transcriptional regulator